MFKFTPQPKVEKRIVVPVPNRAKEAPSAMTPKLKVGDKFLYTEEMYKAKGQSLANNPVIGIVGALVQIAMSGTDIDAKPYYQFQGYDLLVFYCDTIDPYLPETEGEKEWCEDQECEFSSKQHTHLEKECKRCGKVTEYPHHHTCMDRKDTPKEFVVQFQYTERGLAVLTSKGRIFSSNDNNQLGWSLVDLPDFNNL